jgi:acetyl-CoA acetyltransferase family protein
VKESVIVSVARTPFGRAFSGSLADASEFDLAKAVVRGAIDRSGLDSNDIDNVMLGEVYQGGGCIARYAALDLGLPADTPGVAIGGFCASGMMAIHHAVASIRSGMSRCIVAGGVTSISQSKFFGPTLEQTGMLEQECSPSHPGMGELPVLDLVVNLGEGTAKMYGLTRAEVDEWACRSHSLAVQASDDGMFDFEKVKVDLEAGEAFTDELPHPGLDIELLRSMDSFLGPEFTVTVGNQTALTDGAAAVAICDADFAKARGVTPLAEVIGWSVTATEPNKATAAAITSMRRALDVAGVRLDDVDLFEIHDSYASIGVAFEKELEIDRDIVNVLGGGLALGHPYAASGTRVATALINALKRRGGGIGAGAIVGAGGIGAGLVLNVFGDN